MLSASRWATYYLLLTTCCYLLLAYLHHTCYLLLATCDLLLATCDLRLATCDLRLATTCYVLATRHRWVLCLSMGPGACLEGLVLRPPRKLLPELCTRGAFELDPASLERLQAAPKERLRLSDSSPQRPRPTGSSAQHAPRSSLHRSCHICKTITLTL